MTISAQLKTCDVVLLECPKSHRLLREIITLVRLVLQCKQIADLSCNICCIIAYLITEFPSPVYRINSVLTKRKK